jgi:hypothetical protein
MYIDTEQLERRSVEDIHVWRTDEHSCKNRRRFKEAVLAEVYFQKPEMDLYC